MRGRLFSILKFLVGWPLSFIALFFIYRLIQPQWGSVQLSLTNLKYSLILLAILSFITYYFFRCLIWYFIMCSQGYAIPFKDTSFLWAMSEVNRYIPGNIWSFLGRTMLFGKRDVEKRHVASALLLEAQFVLLGAAVVSLFAASFLLYQFIPALPFKEVFLYFAYLVVICLGALYVFQSEILSFFGKTPKGYLQHLMPGFGSGVQLRLLAASVAGFFFFGLGYYFAISAVVFLNPQLLFPLIGLFVFSLLLGYLSFLTPTGLGVREGAIVLGLAKIINTGVAGFAAVFARIVLVLSEVVFIAITFFWHRIKNKTISSIERMASVHKYEALLILMAGVFFVYFVVVSFLRYENFYTGRFDLGNMSQTVWNTTQGRVFVLTNPDGTETVSRLAVHADFILILLAPFYALWPDPRMLLLVQTLIVACGGIFVYLLSLTILKNKPLSLLFAFLFFINPSVERATMYDFHAVVLATTFLLAACYFLLKKQHWLFLFMALFSAITKEQVWLITGMLGLYFALKNKDWIFGGVLFIVSLGMLYYLIWHAIPDVRGSSHFALSYYDDAGDSPSSLITNTFLSPNKTAAKLLSPDRIDYLRQIFLPLGYLPLAAPFLLIFALPDLGINLLSNNANLYQIYYQYTAIITPFLFIAALYGLVTIRERFPRIPSLLYIGLLLIASIYSQYAFGPLPGGKDANIAMFVKQVPNRERISSVLSAIPPQASVAASNNIGAHLSHREHLYTIPIGMMDADYIAFLLTDPGAQPSLETQKQWASALLQNPFYEVVANEGDFVVVRKKQL